MKHEALQSVRNALFAVVIFGLVPAAYGATLHVANNGVDGAACGATTSPCRSITQGINNAVAGDTILVGPGLYGDLNGNGVLGEPGEETPASGVMLLVSKRVIILSTDGAAATVIDARLVSQGRNVGIGAGVEFGRPEHGFLVTNSHNGGGIVIGVGATNVKVRGNQLVSSNVPESAGSYGIEALNDPSATALIEENQAIGWTWGIFVRDAGKTVSKNHVSLNTVGISAADASVVGNVATANQGGIQLLGAASAVGNATYGNFQIGFGVETNFTGVIQKNNIFGNHVCGLVNAGVVGLVATNNYWGAATGPGPDPADTACNFSPGTTTTTPFALKPFAINPPFEP